MLSSITEKHIVDFFKFSYHENFKAHDSYKHISY